MKQAGLSPANVAAELGVSREAVSQWLKNRTFPRSDRLLKLGLLLNLPFDKLVTKKEDNTPIIAFHRRRGTKTRDHHIKNAQDMGRLLRHLVPYLPFDTPHTVVIPVLWGDGKQHTSALHIHLPDSQTTWIYLNLDANIHDFGNGLSRYITRFNQSYHSLSVTLFGEGDIDPKHFIKTTSEAFNTPFFDMLGKHLRESGYGAGYVQSVMGLPLLDAKGIHAELV